MNLKQLLVIFSILFYLPILAIAESDVLATVGNKIITQVDVNRRIELLKSKGAEINDNKESQSLILNQLIEEYIKIFETEKYNIKISKKELDDEINNIHQRHPNISKDNASMILYLKSELSWMKLVRGKFMSRALVSDSELEEGLKTQTMVRNYKIGQILFNKDIITQSNDHLISKLAKDVNSCEKLSIITDELHIDKPEIFVTDIKDLNPMVQSLVKNLSVGKLSNIIDLGDFNLLIMVCNIEKKSFDQNDKSELKNILFDRKIKKIAENYLKDIKKKYYIKIESK